MKRIILASASPRRRDLLRSHFQLEVRPADCDESRRANESPTQYVRRVAKNKFQIVAKKTKKPSAIVSADTTVAMGSKIFGKPKNISDARKMLKALSGRNHRVMTAVCVGISSRGAPDKFWVTITAIRFRKISKTELENYLRSSEWKGKAGAYAIQGRASVFVSEIRGSLTNVIGLPLEETLKALSRI